MVPAPDTRSKVNEDWMTEAACKVLNIPPVLFFQEIGRRPSVTEVAVRVCNSCHVKDECLDYAIANNIKDGIWGGLTARERKQTRRVRIMLDRSA